jgi:hypothetical protein
VFMIAALGPGHGSLLKCAAPSEGWGGVPGTKLVVQGQDIIENCGMQQQRGQRAE